MALKAVMRPVRGFSSDGTFSISIEKRALSASTSMRWMLRLSPGSAQISSRVSSGPMPARLKRRGHVDVRREAARSFARTPVEDLERAVEPVERDAALDEVGCPLEAAWRLARHHAGRADHAFGRSAHGIEADERTRRHEDARAVLPRELDELGMREEHSHGKRHEDASGLECRPRHLEEDGGRCAFEHHIRHGRELAERDHGDADAEAGHAPFRFLRVARGDGREAQALDTCIEPPGDGRADRTEAADGDAERCALRLRLRS